MPMRLNLKKAAVISVIYFSNRGNSTAFQKTTTSVTWSEQNFNSNYLNLDLSY